MKIRHPLLVKAGGFAGSLALRLWMRTLRYHYRPLGEDTDPRRPGLATRYIYAMWHEYLLLPVYIFARPDIHVLISKHADGGLIAEVCRQLGVPVVRGSTSRGGTEAVRQLLRAGQDTHLAMTPDGPRGPRRVVQPGLIYLASRVGLPIVPVGFGLDRPWRANSWDRFAVPRPWSRAACVTAPPIAVPPDADRHQQDEYCRQVNDSLAAATAAAEGWARSGVWRNAEPATEDGVPASLAG
jgi:lysophospholipid acyltransferase (LPLAT)-like uncharacterized protein